MPEPLASIVDHLDELDEVPEFISTADLAEVFDFDAAWLGRRLAELGCQSTRERVTSESGRTRQIRGYLVADLIAAADAARDGRTVLPQAQKACTREPVLPNAPVTARGERP